MLSLIVTSSAPGMNVYMPGHELVGSNFMVSLAGFCRIKRSDLRSSFFVQLIAHYMSVMVRRAPKKVAWNPTYRFRGTGIPWHE
jgi:hypothetical protein